jgi:threonine/homoserine/homoserine lactone efflux protein
METPFSSPWFGVAGAIAVAAITPGPNNVIVMRAAATRGMAGAVPAMVGIVLGGLGLMALVLSGVLPLFAALPWARPVAVTVGCAYLAWLGLRLVTSPPVTQEASSPSASSRLWPCAGFQFLNPKSWVLMLSAGAAVAADADTSQALFSLGAMLVLIPLICLTIWSMLGAALARFLLHDGRRRRFDRFMGLLLLACALTMLRSA